MNTDAPHPIRWEEGRGEGLDVVIQSPARLLSGQRVERSPAPRTADGPRPQRVAGTDAPDYSEAMCLASRCEWGPLAIWAGCGTSRAE